MEDYELVRQLVCGALESAGSSPVPLAYGIEVLVQIRREPFDLALPDLGSPTGKGASH